MTREEIEELKGLAASMGLYDDKHPCKRAVILGKAIKELEQEPCEDAVSRADLLNAIYELDAAFDDNFELDDGRCYKTDLEKMAMKLPLVQPNQRAGEWTEDGHNLGDNWIFTGWKCSVCGRYARKDRYDRYIKSDFCPDCGARLVDQQENER